jgi:hypothetical protein
MDKFIGSAQAEKKSHLPQTLQYPLSKTEEILQVRELFFSSRRLYRTLGL